MTPSQQHQYCSMATTTVVSGRDSGTFTVASPPAPPPPGFFPEDKSLYRRPPPWFHRVNRGPNMGSMASPGVLSGPTKCTGEELITARENSILRACAGYTPQMLSSELPDETLLLLWCQALVKKRRIVTQLADAQFDCEKLERGVMDRLGEETAQKTLEKVYDLGDTCSTKGRLMLSLSNITYNSIEKLAL